MRIGELAELAGTTTRALRYYESRGLLVSRRDANGHRAYGEDDLRVLRQILMLRAFGFDLEETRPFVECLRAGNPAGDTCPAPLQAYRDKLAELEACIAQLSAVRDTVRERLLRAESGTAARPPAVPPEPRCELAAHPTGDTPQVPRITRTVQHRAG
ncbi:MerR family transcriptional regulator [Streptomyces specialis]|uniref:MerR family transcriptional regulator n=1 Tax=Streptomyces specialis TaxID=498367 RepID=UPI00073E9C42|nr:MerR family transcriptional regulator [Streptomyces specialis]